MQTQAPSTNEDDMFDMSTSKMKGQGFAHHKVVDLDPHANVFEFDMADCRYQSDGTASTALTVAPSEGCASIGFSNLSMLSYRTEGIATIGLSRLGLPQTNQEATLDESLKMEPVKITSVAPSPSSRNSDGTAIASRFGTVMQSNDSLPSVGSIDHGTGLCKPCAWFWKPSSCLNGKECCHCHLCPAGEIKSRKKAKSGTTQGRPGKTEPAYISSQSNELGEDSTPTLSATGSVLQLVSKSSDLAPNLNPSISEKLEPSFEDTTASVDDLPDGIPSVGAQLHGSGECRPCAWFYKPQGCSNGTACKHCHLCPEGELKNRKKKGQSSGTKLDNEAGATRISVESVEAEASNGEIRVGSSPPGLPGPMPSGPSESVGSEKHGTGECRPCAWYWKPGSCSNGKECMHCHLCSDSEIKMRKKAKLQNLRASSKEPDDNAIDTQEDNQSHRRSSRSPGRNDGSPKQRQSGRRGSRTADSATPPPLHLEMLQVLEPTIDINDEEVQANLPSVGSGLHALGKCKPCAWHWKPGGCTNGKECCHCHICPSGELKGRRKAKETAMRAGALLPSKIQQRRSSSTTRASMHVLKLFPLL
mmetsp:Transcript_63546/g.98896  ORF Transcript_63546/g.98896 Transcript_63546/m.98896 type:complete len:588 (-) Transcript_63546:110-1873(-)